MHNSYCRTRLVFWWVIPCKAISGVLRELAERFDVTVVFAGELTSERKQLGWELPNFGNARLRILSQVHWHDEVLEILSTTRDSLHVFNTVYAYEKISYALCHAKQLGMEIAVMTEASNNAFSGLKWLAKEAYLRLYLPFKTRNLARTMLFVLCLSGGSRQALSSMRRLGWSQRQIYPFGYFSEQDPADDPCLVSEVREVRTPKLLCTGYLTRNKGHHVLLQALNILKKRHFRFSCEITGYGPEESSLVALTKDCDLDDRVFFRGVLPTSQLNSLMHSSDIFVAPGLCEPWGVRINEAIQAGLAVVVSDGIGASELVKAGRCGAVVPAGNIAGLANSLMTLVSDSSNLAELKMNAMRFREHIHPKAAAGYFEQILIHTSDNSHPRPIPPWL